MSELASSADGHGSGLRLVLARHGETLANAARFLDSRPPGQPLTELGHEQAAQLTERLATEPVVAVYASRATRAQQTAAPVAARHGLAVTVLDGVHEAFIGDYEGRDDDHAYAEFRDVYHGWHAGDLTRHLPGGESGQQVLDRYLADVRTLRDTHPDGTVVLVSHGAALRLVASALASNVEGAFADEHFMPNTGTVVLEPDGDGWHCARWNDVELD